MSTKLSDGELATAIRLLKRNSSINAVSAYLKRRGLVSSANSWEAMLEVRLKPGLRDGSLTRLDIVRLLRDSEEFGRQHVFLYRYPKAEVAVLTNEASLRKRLARLDLEDVFTTPRIVEAPRGLQIVDVRLEPAERGADLVVKAVDVRRHRKLMSAVKEGNREILTYEWEEDRSISVLRVASNGLTEVRVQSHKNAVDYGQEVESLFAKCTDVVDRLNFEDLSLAKARLYMIVKRKSLASTVKFIENTLRSKKGSEMRTSTGNAALNMFEDDEELDGSTESFLSKGNGRSNCDAVNCIWLKRPSNVGPVSDIHTYIGGANNEFIVVPQCERSDYEYVLEKITSFAK